MIAEKEKLASVTGKILFNLVKEKFVSLVSEEPASGRYDIDYFRVQLSIVRLLLDHKLFMQAYTVMRELVGSFGLVEMKKKAIISNKHGRKERKKAEVFINMLQYDEEKWNFSGSKEEIKNGLKPLYEKMANAGIAGELKNFCKELVDYRNGFDHAWTNKNGASQDIELKGNKFLIKLENVVSSLAINGILAGNGVA